LSIPFTRQDGYLVRSFLADDPVAETSQCSSASRVKPTSSDDKSSLWSGAWTCEVRQLHRQNQSDAVSHLEEPQGMRVTTAAMVL
jgi:hypothetical protein